MIIGIDIGGTHSDGVLIEKQTILATHKSLTLPQNLSQTIVSVISDLLKNYSKKDLKKIIISTTLITNALSKNMGEKTGAFIIYGLGLSPHFFQQLIPDCFVTQSGYIDHRGMLVKSIDTKELEKAADFFTSRGIKKIAVISKFSVRNNALEQMASDFFQKKGFKTYQGSAYSGKLNFPRRVFTTWLISSIDDLYHQTMAEIQKAIRELGINCPLYILKADGGACLLEESFKYPLDSVFSGPAGSILGSMVFDKNQEEDTIVLDIGGTTADLGFFIEGSPILEPEGITLQNYPTLIRALKVFPLPIGGDSVFFLEPEIGFHNKREGIPYFFGGKRPTLTDLLLFLEKNEPKAEEGILAFYGKKEKSQFQKVKNKIIDFFRKEIESKIMKINDKPIYTIRAFFEKRIFKPKRVLLIGGAAPFFAQTIEEALNIPVIIPENYGVCNALGAAFSKITAEINLFANTADGVLSIPEIHFFSKIDRSFTEKEAQKIILDKLFVYAKEKGLENLNEAEITESVSFNMVRGFMTTGRNIRVKAQIKPGIAKEK